MVRFGIIGTAKIANKIAPGIQKSERATLQAIGSRTLYKARDFAKQFSIPNAYEDYQTVLDDEQVDAVYIPLPPSLHEEWVIRCAEAGKHVLCEKPLGCNAASVQNMIDACQKNGVVLLDGVMWYHTPRGQQMSAAVIDGTLGHVRQITSVFTFCWDEWQMQDFRMHREFGGGSLLDLGWYCVGAALLYCQRLPHTVYAQATYHNDVDVRMNGFLSFSDGLTATIECGFDTVRRRWIEVAGTKKNLVCDDFTRPWQPEKPRYWIHDNNGVADAHIVHQPAQETCMVDAFCELIKQKHINHRWQQLSQQTQQVCDALANSARTGTVVTLE